MDVEIPAPVKIIGYLAVCRKVASSSAFFYTSQ
jgi:hypothetical protein